MGRDRLYQEGFEEGSGFRLGVITEALEEGDDVMFTGFGKFEPRATGDHRDKSPDRRKGSGSGQGGAKV